MSLLHRHRWFVAAAGITLAFAAVSVFAHKSQDGERIYSEFHQEMESFRGRESGCGAAEAFVRLARVRSATKLPGMGA